MQFKITDGRDTYIRTFVDTYEARHWVINHLDLSREWSILPYI